MNRLLNLRSGPAGEFSVVSKHMSRESPTRGSPTSDDGSPRCDIDTIIIFDPVNIRYTTGSRNM